MLPEYFSRWDRPLGIGELITVNSAAPVDVVELAVKVRARLGVRADNS